MLERAPKAARGGSSAFTGGAFRTSYEDGADIARITGISDDELAMADFGSYPEARYFGDLAEMSGFRAESGLIELLAADSLPTIFWLRDQGVRFIPSYGRQSFKVDGRSVFWGGLTIEAVGGGLGLMDALFRRAEGSGIEIRYGAKVIDLLTTNGRATGVVADMGADGIEKIGARAVILAAGGYHANAEWRARYLGKGWELAKVRGSRFNTGGVIRAALDRGARSHGNWSGCHSVFFDAGADPFGNLDQLNQQKNYFTLGIVVNTRGERFFDEGAEFRNYVYSTKGGDILQQPGGYGWQIFDGQTTPILPDEYRTARAARFESDTIEGLIAKLEGVDAAGLRATIVRFNAACDPDTPFNPAVKDGKATRGLAVEKTNWALPISKPPFVAYQVTCGITCTYAGLAIDEQARVLSEEGPPIDGLFACGELVGGLYYGRYPGGAGLTSGAVFGRVAGKGAASYRRQ